MQSEQARHRLVLIDRGNEHRHRWHSTCVCGWVAVFRRRKCDAKKLYRQHVESETHHKHGRRRAQLNGGRRQPTPRHLLPEELR